MNTMRPFTALFVGIIALVTVTTAALWPTPARAFYNLKVGDAVPSDPLMTIEGEEGTIWVEGMEVSLFLFFKPDQPNSLKALQELAKLPAELEGKKLSLVGIVSSEAEMEQVQAAVEQAGFEGQILIDLEDEFYGKLGAVMTPALGIASAEGKLVHYQPYQRLNYGVVVKAHILHHLGELDDAGLQKVLAPPKATQGGTTAVAQRRVNMGRMLLKGKKFEKALKMADEAIKKDPKLAAGYGLRAAVLAADGKCKGARKSMIKAQKLDTEDKLAAEAEKACPPPKAD